MRKWIYNRNGQAVALDCGDITKMAILPFGFMAGICIIKMVPTWAGLKEVCFTIAIMM